MRTGAAGEREKQGVFLPMQDFKPRRGNAKRKSPRRRKQKNSGLSPQTPTFAPLAPAGRRRGAKIDWRAAAARIPSLLHKTFFAAALGWLALGLVIEGLALWRSPLRHVDVRGNRALAASDLVARAGLHAGLAMGRIDPFAVSVRLMALPRIAAVDVRRIFPGRVDLVVTERIPAAVVERPGSPPLLIDAEGVMLGATKPGDPTLAGLPRLRYSGRPPPPRNKAAGPLAWGLATAEAVRRLAIAGGGRFTLVLDAPFAPELILPEKRQRVILPLHAAGEALATFRSLALPMIEGVGGWRTIDLRMMAPMHGARIVIRK